MTNTLELSRGLFVFLSSPGYVNRRKPLLSRSARRSIYDFNSAQPANAAWRTGPRHGTPLMTRFFYAIAATRRRKTAAT